MNKSKHKLNAALKQAVKGKLSRGANSPNWRWPRA